MSATNFVGIKYRAFYPTAADGSAAPLAGGMLYSYAAGTTTPQNTYTDQTGTVANTNPVILDANGEASVWLTGNYKFVLQDPVGNVLETQDNIQDTIFSAAFSATSTTSNTIGTGSLTFITQSGKSLIPGQYVIISSTVTPTAYVIGQITSYVGTSLTINATTSSGSGTYTSWNIGLSGPGASDATIAISNITTNNATTTQHGFLPTLSGNATDYFSGAGTYVATSTIVKPTPTYQYLTSSGTYTTPANVREIVVTMQGSGGGGAAATTNAGTSAGSCAFGTWTVNGGGGGSASSGSTYFGGAGGTGGTNGTGSLIRRSAGNGGTVALPFSALGGAGIYGGVGAAVVYTSAPNPPAANSGSGGNSAANSSGSTANGGGGAGENVIFSITSPAATYSVTIAAGGAGGAAGTTAGSAGAAGFILVTEYY